MSRLLIIIHGLYWEVLVFISQLRKLLRQVRCIVTFRGTCRQKQGCYHKSVDLLQCFECIILKQCYHTTLCNKNYGERRCVQHKMQFVGECLSSVFRYLSLTNGDPVATAVLTPVPILRRLGGPQSPSGRIGQEINILPVLGFESRIVQSVVSSVYLSTLSRSQLTELVVGFTAVSNGFCTDVTNMCME